MSGSEGQKVGGEIHNYRNDYKFKFGGHMNASGKWQLEFAIRSDDEDQIVELTIAKLQAFHDGMKDKGFLPVEVKPFVQKEKRDEK